MPIPADGYAPHSAQITFYAADPSASSEFSVNLLFNLDQLLEPGFADNVITAVNDAVTAAITEAYPTHTIAGSVVFGGTRSIALPLTD